MKNTIKIDSKTTKMVAHRGLSGLERENTCRAFIAAGNREKYFGIETDVHITADGKYVCIHDDNTGRVAEKCLFIKDSTFDEVRSVILTDTDGSKTRKDIIVPTLEEYISICKRYGKVSVLELKCNFSVEQVTEIIDIIKAEDYLEQTVFISFLRDPLLIVRQLLPNQKIQYLTGEFNEEILEFMKTHKFDLDILFHSINEENMKLLKDAGIEVNVWTVDNPEDAKRLISLGVDYITTNILE